jgi:hypothetical protein
MKITKEEFYFLFSDSILKKEYDAIISRINVRFQEICKVFLKKGKGSWFDYNTGDYDGSEGQFDPKIYAGTIGVIGEGIEPPLGYDYEFPTRWLWQDFEDELAETSKSYQQEIKKKKEEQKAKRETKRERLKTLQASIRSKLTKEELKAISFKKS